MGWFLWLCQTMEIFVLGGHESWLACIGTYWTLWTMMNEWDDTSWNYLPRYLGTRKPINEHTVPDTQKKHLVLESLS